MKPTNSEDSNLRPADYEFASLANGAKGLVSAQIRFVKIRAIAARSGVRIKANHLSQFDFGSGISLPALAHSYIADSRITDHVFTQCRALKIS